MPATGEIDSMLVMQSPRLRKASYTSVIKPERPLKGARRDYSDFHFVTFFALGDKGDSGHTCVLLVDSNILLYHLGMGRAMIALPSSVPL